jgi:hypothetical protein
MLVIPLVTGKMLDAAPPATMPCLPSPFAFRGVVPSEILYPSDPPVSSLRVPFYIRCSREVTPQEHQYGL